jgi:DNA polymerase/3'-5' exonuclease PolX
LEDLARKMPGTLDELEEVYGLGPQKIEVFGKELLELLCKIA